MTGLLTEGPVKRRLALFTLPILVSNILQQLYSAADAVIVGRVAGGNSLAAVGASTPIITLLVALMIGLGAGTEIILARKIGEKDAKGQKITLDSMLTTILVIAVITMLIGFLGSRFLLSLIGTPAEILDEDVYKRQKAPILPMIDGIVMITSISVHPPLIFSIYSSRPT